MSAPYPHPRLLALATAVPPIAIRQSEVAALMARLFGGMRQDFERFLPVYTNAGIEKRHSCVPLDWYTRPHGWVERAALFVDHAEALLENAIGICLRQAGIAAAEVDALVTVCTTGVATPSLDARIAGRLGFRPDLVRLPIFGLGCAGGALGLGRAAALARAMPGARILVANVELCGLTFRANDFCASNVVATALFGDGAAAALLCTQGDGPAITAWGEHTWPDSLDVMGWRMAEDGFGVLFSRDIPTLVQRDLRAAVDGFLEKQALLREGIDRFVCHPGGAKVVSALETALGLAPQTLVDERAVLRDYGNMSSATLLFVLDRRLREPTPGRDLLLALGPGFTAGFVLMEA